MNTKIETSPEIPKDLVNAMRRVRKLFIKNPEKYVESNPFLSTDGYGCILAHIAGHGLGASSVILNYPKLRIPLQQIYKSSVSRIDPNWAIARIETFLRTAQ